MTREISEPAVHTGATVALLPFHRALPVYSLSDLSAAAKRPGPVQRAARHVVRCARCRERAWTSGLLCPEGARLAAMIKSSPTRTRAKREGAA
jgi:hypothetical protein